MKSKEKNISADDDHYRCLEDVIGCKWSVSVLMAAASGVTRPGAMERHIPEISTKVLNERLRKLSAYGLLEQERFPEVPPRTEYRLTPFGERVVALVGQLRALDAGRAGG
jgi:DNA-binding HxlR family transcriptional regulator